MSDIISCVSPLTIVFLRRLLKFVERAISNIFLNFNFNPPSKQPGKSAMCAAGKGASAFQDDDVNALRKFNPSQIVREIAEGLGVEELLLQMGWNASES